MEKITTENWSSCAYLSNKLMALITFGAEPVGDSIKDIYYVTVLDMKDEGKEVFQREFQELSLAIDTINEKYSSWEFSMRKNDQGSGCSDCAAH